MVSVCNQWRPPRQGRYKVNVDGAVFACMGCCGVGVVIRNEEESDAQTVVLAIGGSDPGPCSIQKVVEGAKLWLTAFSTWSCSHVRGQSNMAARLMAKEAFNVNECLIWVEDNPAVIANQIHMDVIALDSLS
ncbi:hypothetical protein ACB092_08G196400 [Castanea dentata]